MWLTHSHQKLSILGYQRAYEHRPTFYVGDVNVELAEFLASPLHALVDRLHYLLGVFLHPSD